VEKAEEKIQSCELEEVPKENEEKSSEEPTIKLIDNDEIKQKEEESNIEEPKDSFSAEQTDSIEKKPPEVKGVSKNVSVFKMLTDVMKFLKDNPQTAIICTAKCCASGVWSFCNVSLIRLT